MDGTQRLWRSSFVQVGADLCSKHNSPLDAYCCTDERVICASCADSDHRGHTIGLVQEERKRKQEEARNLKKKCKGLLQQQDKQKEMDQILEKALETEDFCEAVLTNVIDLLQTHYLSLRKLVHAQQESAVSSVQKRTVEVKRLCSELDRVVHIDNDVHFLQEWPSVRQRCQEDLPNFTDGLFLPFETLQNAVDSLGNQLQEFCNRKFASITQSDHWDPNDRTEDHYVQIPDDDSYDVYEVTCSGIQNTDPQTREDFLQFACELTMDPSTAHEDLLLSPNHKEVRLAPVGVRGRAARYPERFLHRRQLLCTEGLQADSYYEIEVTGGSAEIALAYKCISRKSRFKPSAFGGDATSWSLDCTPTHYSVSHRGDSVELTSVPEHSRIGVYLRFREGIVYFYEVSGNTMKFLYKMEDVFTEALYPGFWIGDNCCIRICDLAS